MHVDKIANGYVVDQNVDQISREIAYVPLGGEIRSKCSSCMQFFFSFGMITRYAYLEDDKSWLMFLEDQGFLGFSSCFQKTKGSGSWLMFSKDQRFWILAHVFRDLGFLDLGSCFQRTKGFWGFAHVFREPKVLDPGSCFQRPRIFGSWLMFSEDQGSGSWLMFSET